MMPSRAGPDRRYPPTGRSDMTGLLAATLAAWMHVTAYSFDDAVRDIVPGRNGVLAMKEIAGVLDRTGVQITTNPETDEFFAFVRKTMEQFDFMKLYRSRYCKSMNNGYCGVALQGCGGERSYSVVVETPGTIRCPMTHLWDFRTEYGLKRNEHNAAGGQSFIASVSSRTATGRFSHRNLMAFVTSLLRILDPSNINTLRAPEAPVFTSVEGNGRKIINDFHRSFPKTSELFNRYADLRSVAEIKTHNGVPYTRCEFRYGYRIKNLAAEFPRIAKSLTDIRGLYRITMDVKNPAGNTILYLVFDSRDEVFTLSCYTRNGKLVPRDSVGNPLFREEISPASLTDISYRAVMGMLHRVHGLNFSTPATTIGFSYYNSPAGGSWRIKLLDVSRTEITGSYYDILPPWLIDAFIPGDMEQLINDFSRVLINGNDGRGAGVSFEWDTRNPSTVMLDFTAAGEFMDNKFLRYGLRVWSKKTFGDRQLGLEFKRLRVLMISTFLADLGGLR